MRHREQAGTIYSKCGSWYVRYSDFRVTEGQLERKRLSKQLGSMAEMNKKQAREEARNFLTGINRPTLMPETAVTFVAFVKSVYLPRIEQRTRPSTFRGYQTLWKQLKPFCANLWTRDIRTRHVQGILDAMALTGRFNLNSMKHIKSFLSGIFRLADQQGYFDGANPARETSLPQSRAADETHAYSLEEVIAMIAAVPEPAATLIATAAFTGARRGELRDVLGELPRRRNAHSPLYLEWHLYRSQEPQEQGPDSGHSEPCREVNYASRPPGKPDSGPDLPERGRKGSGPRQHSTAQHSPSSRNLRGVRQTGKGAPFEYTPVPQKHQTPRVARLARF